MEDKQLKIPCYYPKVGYCRRVIVHDFCVDDDSQSDSVQREPYSPIHKLDTWYIFQDGQGRLFIFPYIPFFREWLFSKSQVHENRQDCWAVRESNGTIYKGHSFDEFVNVSQIEANFNLDEKKCFYGELKLNLNLQLSNDSSNELPTYTLKELGF